MSGIRVIAGSAKGTHLKLVTGDSTRPIMDRVKENLFNILQHELHGSRWLDLFAGTGGVGIEALSRGAEHVTFVDNNRNAIKTILENLTATHFREKATVRHSDAFHFLESAETTPFNIIYIAPPQYHSLWVGALVGIAQRLPNLLAPQGLIVVQIDPKEFRPLRDSPLTLFRQEKYGSTLLCFYELQTNS